jgi:transcription elongation factor Elf1
MVKKDAKKFKSIKAKRDENEKLVTCIVCPSQFSLIGCIKKIQEIERLVQTLHAEQSPSRSKI